MGSLAHRSVFNIIYLCTLKADFWMLFQSSRPRGVLGLGTGERGLPWDIVGVRGSAGWH